MWAGYPWVMQDIASGEGLFPLEIADVPGPVRAAAGGVVRVGSRLRFRVKLLEGAEAAARERAKPEARARRFLPGGGVEWPVISDAGTLLAICGDEARAAQPGFHELCAAYRQHGAETGSFLTEPLRAGATGFTLAGPGDDVRIVTNYHVAREGIERAGRADGSYDSDPIDCPDTWVATAAWKRARSVKLEANASEAGWRAGCDWAVLRVSVRALPLTLRSGPPQPGERVWVLGFPTRTTRRPRGYPDADGSLRVASGVILHTDETQIVSDVDGVAGNSGSPVLDERGRVVGVFRDHDHRDGDFDLRVGGYGGRAFITPTCCLPAWLAEPRR